ncbi:hypothetical protein O181_020008 [Austropuccinia psidii MF-1]|uniref:Uncharacterized protein n=1 Tax=Austropuccinia psidii MF-1 TaxID=1389203 RepID=A0A9Q3GU48_9BASI|nr:hypothetical protein [Austropuccinia psidii MF-1]
MNVCNDNSQPTLIIDSLAHFLILEREYLYKEFPNLEKQLFLTKENNLKSASGKITSIDTILKEIMIPHGKFDIRINPESVVLEDSQIHVFILGTDSQRIYGTDIYNSRNRYITIGTNKEKKFSLDIYQLSNQDHLEELLNELKEG